MLRAYYGRGNAAPGAGARSLVRLNAWLTLGQYAAQTGVIAGHSDPATCKLGLSSVKIANKNADCVGANASSIVGGRFASWNPPLAEVESEYQLHNDPLMFTNSLFPS